MQIHALTVCVEYADFLALSVERWLPGLASWTIVSTPGDRPTADIARAHGLRLHTTDVFYANGAAFNKGAAMEEARAAMPWEDWILFLDADIVPGYGWAQQIDEYAPRCGQLYSARRRECPDPSMVDNLSLQKNMSDGIGVGYFQLFHVDDPALEGDPLIETDWVHAGCYDSSFMHRWPRRARQLLPIRLVHVGERNNWFGRGNTEQFKTMMQLRRERGGYEHERIGVYGGSPCK
uniref:Putative glycosyltransferase n=1 Tax=viral metagenome TaxID=1070528 RepID=A0A6M3IPT7_9ZZZZ